jgi:hypothetical protein
MVDCSTKVAEGLVEVLEQQVAELTSHRPSSIAEMETQVQEALWQLGKVWLSSWLNEMGKEQAAEIPCECGERAKYVRMREGVILSLFGRVSFKRRYYLCSHCHKGRYALDTELGYESGKMTPQLVSIAGWVGAQLPFQRSAELLQVLCGISLSENSVRQATQRIGEAVEAEEETWQEESLDIAALRERDLAPADDVPERLYGSLDGVQVPVGEEWRELKIGSWYTEQDTWRSQKPSATDLTYYCDITEARDFAALFWATGYRRWADQARELIFVADGAVWIWNLVTDYFPRAIQIVDWYHAVAYIAPIANAAFGEGSDQARAWRDQVRDDLWEGRFDQVLASFQQWADHPQAGPAAQQAFTYYTNNRERMRYPDFRAKGYRIGSGVAESACKQIGTQRLKVAGARWSESGARQTAKARAALLSNQWSSVTSSLGAVALAA